MFVSLRLLTLPPDRIGERDAILAALQAAAPALPGVQGCWIAPVSAQAVINAGHIVWRMTFATEAEALAAPRDPLWRTDIAPLLANADMTLVGYRIPRSQVRATGPGIWRALIFRVFAHADPALVRALAEHTLRLPQHIRDIRSWALSPVAHGEGTRAYDFVWEQEYGSLDGLTGPYMTNPVHWGLVDAYFDAEYPEYIVDPQLIQVVGDIAGSIIDAVGPQESIMP